MLMLPLALRMYSTGTKYLSLWRPNFSGPGPGAGDVLVSTLDAGIVSLAIPMYRYRRDLKEHVSVLCFLLSSSNTHGYVQFFRMMTIIIPCCSLSLFVWPTVANAFGMDLTRSLAFAARFMSTPLAIELVEALEGDESICVILVVVTGIVAAILKDWFFYKLMRVNRGMSLSLPAPQYFYLIIYPYS